MSVRVSERAFEEAIEAALLEHGPNERPDTPRRDIADESPPYGDPGMRPDGYHKRRPEDYDRTHSIRRAGFRRGDADGNTSWESRTTLVNLRAVSVPAGFPGNES